MAEEIEKEFYVIDNFEEARGYERIKSLSTSINYYFSSLHQG